MSSQKDMARQSGEQADREGDMMQRMRARQQAVAEPIGGATWEREYFRLKMGPAAGPSVPDAQGAHSGEVPEPAAAPADANGPPAEGASSCFFLQTPSCLHGRCDEFKMLRCM